MDQTEYVNVYIDVLNKSLHEANSKAVMQEARIILLERAVERLNAELQKASAEIDKYKKKKGNPPAPAAEDF